MTVNGSMCSLSPCPYVILVSFSFLRADLHSALFSKHHQYSTFPRSLVRFPRRCLPQGHGYGGARRSADTRPTSTSPHRGSHVIPDRYSLGIIVERATHPTSTALPSFSFSTSHFTLVLGIYAASGYKRSLPSPERFPISTSPQHILDRLQ